MVAAVIAAVVVVVGYFVQQGLARSARRAALYAEAIRAVNDYVEAPYLVLRHDGSGSVRWDLVRHISDVQSRIAYHQAALDQLAPSSIADTYRNLVVAARREAGAHMTAAWRSKPIKRDRDVPIEHALAHPDTDELMTKLVQALSPRASLLRLGIAGIAVGSVLLPVGSWLSLRIVAPEWSTPIAVALQAGTAIVMLGCVIRYSAVRHARPTAIVLLGVAVAFAASGAFLLPLI
jgi:hypothetical protein